MTGPQWAFRRAGPRAARSKPATCNTVVAGLPNELTKLDFHWRSNGRGFQSSAATPRTPVLFEHLGLGDFREGSAKHLPHYSERRNISISRPGPGMVRAEYISRLGRGEPDAHALFLRATHLGRENRGCDLSGFAKIVSNTSTHLWMWDEVSMTQAPKDHGFDQIRRCRFGDCQDTMFSIVGEQ